MCGCIVTVYLNVSVHWLLQLHCCGADGPSDWQTSAWKHNQTDPTAVVPKTCCVLSNNDPANPKPKNNAICQADAATFQRHSKYLHTQVNTHGLLEPT